MLELKGINDIMKNERMETVDKSKLTLSNIDRKMNYVSLFSSAGVGCFGFKMNNFECIATNELIEKRLMIQKYNNKCKYDTGYILGDITSAETKGKLFKEIDNFKKLEKIKEVDVVIATPPCQGMSVANHKKNDIEIIRNSLVVESIRIINDIKPKVFIFENVAAFMKTICTNIDRTEMPIGQAIDVNLGNSYSIFDKVINFKNYGSASSRTRTLVIGVRNDCADFVSPIELFPDFSGDLTLESTIGDLKRLEDFGEIDEDDIYHFFRVYPKHMRSWISDLKEGQSAFDNTDESLRPHQIKNGVLVHNLRKNGDKYTRQSWAKVGPCIHTRNDQFASQNTIHPMDDRVFSIRELMKMMTIPFEFKWTETSFEELNNFTLNKKREFLKKNEMNIRQSIGEAVPTKIFQNVSSKINDFFKKANLKTVDINSIIESENLGDTDNLIRFITENSGKIGYSSLCKIAELANALRLKHAAYYTNKSIVSEIIRTTPEFIGSTVRVLEPSVGVGNFLPLIFKKYDYIESLEVDVVDIDPKIISVLKTLLIIKKVPQNVKINFIESDFLLYKTDKKYDLVIGNPPFSKLGSGDPILKIYKKSAYNKQTTNTFAFFLERSIMIADFVAMITPKFLLNTSEFDMTRDFLRRRRVEHIIDFGEHGFEDVLVETIAVCVSTVKKPLHTTVKSFAESKTMIQKQSYIFDDHFPYWVIYRDSFFDSIITKLEFGVFSVFRDRQITNSITGNSGIRVIKSRNINDAGTIIQDIPGYDGYISENEAKTLMVFKYLNRDDVYLTPNMTYNPRVIRKPRGYLVNGSVAILIPVDGLPLTNNQMLYFSSAEYRRFYKIARNYQTRSLNVDAKSVYFFGRLIED